LPLNIQIRTKIEKLSNDLILSISLFGEYRYKMPEHPIRP